LHIYILFTTRIWIHCTPNVRSFPSAYAFHGLSSLLQAYKHAALQTEAGASMHREAFRSKVELLGASKLDLRLHTSQAGTDAKASWEKRQAKRRGRSFTVPNLHSSLERLSQPLETSTLASTAATQHLTPLAEAEESYRRHGATERSAMLHSAKSEWFTRQARKFQQPRNGSPAGAPNNLSSTDATTVEPQLSSSSSLNPATEARSSGKPGEAWASRSRSRPTTRHGHASLARASNESHSRSRGTSLLEKLIAERKQAETRAQEKARQEAAEAEAARHRGAHRIVGRSTAPALAALARYKERQVKAKLAAAEAAAAAFVEEQNASQQPRGIAPRFAPRNANNWQRNQHERQKQQKQQHHHHHQRKGPLRFVPNNVAYWRKPGTTASESRSRGEEQRVIGVERAPGAGTAL